IKYNRRGVVGIDVANYDTGMFNLEQYEGLFERARNAGLRVTVHSGETDDTNDMWDVVKYAKPDRIGHGIKAAYDKELMKVLAEQEIVLEVCPISNIANSNVSGVDELRYIFDQFIENGVKFCINSDWPA